MKRKILVTGGSAVAGDGLRRVAAKGEYPGREFFFPSSKELNLLDAEGAAKYVAGLKPEVIVHFAAVSGGITLTLNHPASVMCANVRMNFNVLDAARAAGVKNVIMTLSSSVYSPDVRRPWEELLHQGYPDATNYSYAFAKRLIEPMAKAYGTEYGMDVIGIVPGGILGPRVNFGLESATAVPSIIRRFYEQRNDSKPLTVWGDGSPLRQLTADEDMGRIAMWCVEHHHGPDILNISTIEDISIKEATYYVAELMGVDKHRITFDLSKPTGVKSQSIDNSRFVALSGFRYTPVRATIRRTVEYFAENYPDPTKLRL